MGDYRLTVLTPFPSLQAPGSRFLLLSLWFSVLSAWFSVPGSQFSVLSYMVLSLAENWEQRTENCFQDAAAIWVVRFLSARKRRRAAMLPA